MLTYLIDCSRCGKRFSHLVFDCMYVLPMHEGKARIIVDFLTSGGGVYFTGQSS